MNAFSQGILLGLAITISFGPGFLALFQTSIVRGLKAGFILAIGILISDLCLILVSYFGLGQVFHKNNTLTMGVITGIILFVFGGVSFFRKPFTTWDDLRQISKMPVSMHQLLIKGFILNIANPFSLLFWIGIMGYAVSKYGMYNFQFYVFFLGLILTAFSSDLLKCYLSSSLRNVFTPSAITMLNKVIGLLLMGIGIFIIIKVMI
jgi:threonine/homoserine/homoserine lactone efflux protein